MSEVRGGEKGAGRAPEVTAELRKLAHTLDTDPARMEPFAGLPGDDIRTLRKQINEALFQADKHYFSRVATLARTVPTGVTAKITEVVLPPLIAARTAELIEPRKAAEMVGKISVDYMARVATYLDASRAPEVIAAIPTDKIAAVGAELAARKEWIVIGGFVSVVTPEALAASVAEYDGEALLRIGFVLEDLSRMDTIGSLLSETQIDQLLAAAPRSGLWVELRDLLAHLADERRARLAARLAAAAAPLRQAYADAVADGSLDAESAAHLGL
jgi:hypothetical protein